MDDRTLTALRGSIAKWETIVAGTGEDHGTSNCPLCQEFYADGCQACPVAEATNDILCLDTPYLAWSEYNNSGRVEDDEDRRLAQSELDFLRSLLPAAAPK